MLDHPVIKVSEGERITTSRITRGRCRIGMTLAEVHTQPERKADPVVQLFWPKQAEVLIVFDELFEVASWLDP